MQTLHVAAVLLSLMACGAATLAALPPVPPTAEEAARTLVLADPSRANDWDGGAPDPSVTREGIPVTVRWQPSLAHTLKLRNVPRDWTGGPWNTIEFWLHSAKATPGRCLLYIGSENPGTDGMDYYSAFLHLDFTGWKRFSIPLNELSLSRQPRGFDAIDAVRLTTSGWNLTAHPDTDLHVGPIVLRYLKPASGPITSDEQLFAALDLDRPDLQDVRRAVEAQDWLTAKQAFVRHLKTRERPIWHFDWRTSGTPAVRRPSYHNQTAENACRNLLTSCNFPHQFGEHIDWSINPTPNKYSEWTWQLSRHPFWAALGQAYRFTGDEKYAEAYVRQIRGWIIDNPLPKSAANGVGSRWRTIESGIRTASSWPDAFFSCLNAKAFDDDSIIMVVKSFYEHALHLRDFPTSNNWLCMEMNGLYHIGTLFPEFRQAKEWRDYAAKRLYDEMDLQVYPDGAQRELAPGYHGVSLHNFLGTYRIAKLNDQPLPADYIPRLERMYQTYLNYCSPTGCMPALNDSGWGNVRKLLQQGHEFFPNRTDFLYIATQGRQGTLPTFTSNFMPYAGWYNLRSGWGPLDLFCNFEVGPFGAGHQHEDKLSFNLYAYGKRLLTEGGIYAYDTSEWRKYVLSARAHNVVRVDGLDQNRREGGQYNNIDQPLTNRFLTTPVFDFAEGRYDEGFGRGRKLKVTHTRSILFVKPHYWLVLDVMTPPDDQPHSYESWFHLNTARADILPNLKAAISTDPTSANLLILPLNPAALDLRLISGQEKPEVQGWIAQNTYKTIPVATPTFTAKAAGQLLVPYLFLPLQPGQDNPVAAIDHPAHDTFVIRFADGAQDTLTAVPNPTDGTIRRLTLVRQSPTGAITTLSVID